MKRRFHLSAALAIALALCWSSARAQEKPPAEVNNEVAVLRATVENLRAEVALLRKAFLKLELDRRRENIQRINAHIHMVRAEHARLMELDRARQQDLRDIEDLLARGELGAVERIDAESARNEFAVRQGREIAEQSAAARVREGELLRRLETEDQAAKRLEEAWKLIRETNDETIEDFVKKALPGRAIH